MRRIGEYGDFEYRYRFFRWKRGLGLILIRISFLGLLHMNRFRDSRNDQMSQIQWSMRQQGKAHKSLQKGSVGRGAFNTRIWSVRGVREIKRTWKQIASCTGTYLLVTVPCLSSLPTPLNFTIVLYSVEQICPERLEMRSDRWREYEGGDSTRLAL